MRKLIVKMWSLKILLSVFLLGASQTWADIDQWAWVNPSDPSQGVYQSSVVCPGGSGVSAVPNANLNYLDLTQAYLISANLTNARLISTTLTNANLTGATVAGADFGCTNLTSSQLYSTASYQNLDLQGIGMDCNNLTGWDFSGQNLTSGTFILATLTNANLMGANLSSAWLLSATLTSASLTGANLTNAQLSSATLTSASLTGANLTNAQLSSATLNNANLTGATLSRAELGSATLISANLTNANLSNVQLYSTTLTNANLTGANLTNACLDSATLTNANLTGANLIIAELYYTTFTNATVAGADFGGSTLTSAQLYSTASYQNQSLQGIGLEGNNLTGWNFAGQNMTNANLNSATLTNASLTRANLSNASLYYSTLTNANLTNATLTNANFTGADLRGTQGFVLDPTATTTDTIFPDGTIQGLILNSYNPALIVQNYSGSSSIPIHILQGMSMTPEAFLELEFDGNPWGSTISFASGIPVTLDGYLELDLATGVAPASLVGDSFQVFNWTGVSPTGRFAQISNNLPAGCSWDTSQLYTTGEVTLVPEPSTVALLTAGAIGVLAYTWRRRRAVRRTAKAESQDAPPILTFSSQQPRYRETARRAA